MNLMNNINVFDLHEEGVHPVVGYSFAELLQKLNEDVALGRINSRTCGHHVLFDYNSYGIYDHGWSDVAVLARGLVLSLKECRVVAMPFPKFFNWGEATTELPPTDFTATEKMDGSLGICYWYEGDEGSYWRVNTRGSFESDQAVWATKWLAENPEITRNFIRGDTYLFEIIYPSNKIVVTYDFSGLVLLGAYHGSGQEYYREELEELSNKTKVRLVNIHEFDSVEEMLEKAKQLSVNEEGWVLSYPCGYRVKVKGDEYCRVHRLISHCTPLSVWASFVAMDDFESLKKDLPEEFRVDIDNMVQIFTDLFNKKWKSVNEWLNYTREWTNKGIGLGASHGEIPKDMAKWIFTGRKVDLSAEVNRAGDIRKKFCEEFRPHANVLAGYEPTSAMNRFEECES